LRGWDVRQWWFGTGVRARVRSSNKGREMVGEMKIGGRGRPRVRLRAKRGLRVRGNLKG
jgi:hypothetical protein